MGKFMNEFFPPKYFDKYSKFENTILFIAGTEFLVCKRVEKFDKNRNAFTLYIYLREIQIGFGE